MKASIKLVKLSQKRNYTSHIVKIQLKELGNKLKIQNKTWTKQQNLSYLLYYATNLHVANDIMTLLLKP